MAEKMASQIKLEAQPHGDKETASLQASEEVGAVLGRGELQVIAMRERVPILRKLRTMEAWLDKKLGIETTGADRVPEDQRRPPSIFNVCYLPQARQGRC
jgi:hypothetical protein